MLRRTGVRFLGSVFEHDFYDDRVARYAVREAHRLPLMEIKEWYDSGTITEANVVQSAQYVWHELPVRLAKTLMSFESLPLLVLKQRGMHAVFRAYRDVFTMLTNVDRPRSLDEAIQLTDTIKSCTASTADLLGQLSEGLAEARGKLRDQLVERLDEFTHLFIGHRLSRRMLAANHIALTDHFQGQQADSVLSRHEVGIFHRAAPVKTIVAAAAEEAQELCMVEYGQYPEIDIVDAQNTTLFCVPANLQAVLVEVLKNSMKATTERHMHSSRMPPVEGRVLVTDDGTVYIHLEDQGGGMSSASEASLWRYGVSGTTLLDVKGRRKQPAGQKMSVFGIRDMHTKRLSGYGFGLPLSKARANYFGGELWIRNMEGFGVDTYIRMPPATLRWK